MAQGNGKPVSAVAYLRCSTDKQEASIPDQRKEVREYAAKNGYKIVREYVDDGISGDSTEKRLAFQEMIADAVDRRDFAAILCWDQDRFGRFDMMEAGYWVHPLRKVSVSLVTIPDGRIDWEDFNGRMMFGMKQEAKHDFLPTLSRNVIRGQFEGAKSGSWSGSAPYAYRIDGEKKKKTIVADDPGKRKIVKRIFREFVNDGWSMSAIASRLNVDGIPSPGERGKPWRFDAVKVILENVAYIGTFRFNFKSRSKYNSYINGEIVKGARSGRNPEADWIVIENHHEPLIDRTTFDKAQAILAKGKTGRSNKYTPENNPYRLAGILRCGRCGSPLWGVECRGAYRYYECSKQKHEGKDSCEGCTVREDKVLLKIAGDLAEWWGLKCEGIDAAFVGKMPSDVELPKVLAEIRKLLVPPPRPKKDRDRLVKESADLKAKLMKWRRNLIDLDPENLPEGQARIREADDRLAEIEVELRETAPPPKKISTQPCVKWYTACTA